jgi:D-glycero-alpha-D-manno-heptose 1-phosphate guanylyltransferase
VKEAIVLAGGLGTRLKSVVQDVPKPMALVNGRPFLEYILNFLNKNGIEKVILSVGYKKEQIINHFKDKYLNLNIKYAIEDKPLGTGGAIINALTFIESDKFFIINGDTLFDINLEQMFSFFESLNDIDLLIALKKLENAKRYGKVIIDNNYRIIDFIEKGELSKGLINGGIYLLKKRIFENISFPTVFSFEKDFLEKYYNQLNFYGLPFNNYFIDIGVPEDYKRAQIEFS